MAAKHKQAKPRSTSDTLSLGMNSKQSGSRNQREHHTTVTDRDPLILFSPAGYSGTSNNRERLSTSKSPMPDTQQFHSDKETNMTQTTTVRPARSNKEPEDGEVPSLGRIPPSYGDDPVASYEMYSENDNLNNSRSVRSMRSIRSIKSAKSQRDSRFARTFPDGRTQNDRSNGDRLHQYYNEQANRIFSEQPTTADEPINGVSDEIMAVRKSALTVYEPLTYTWLIFSPGFSISAALGMAKWTGLLVNVSYWLMLLPCWLSHLCLLACHVYAVKSLSKFIAQANFNRQRSDSTDHIDRTEYLPLLQRCLKFGIKTGSISLTLFIFEILLYIRLSHGKLSLIAVFTPLWIVAVGGILDGIICKTQHAARVFSWTLFFVFMTLLSLKIDHGIYTITWRMVFGPLFALMGIGTTALVYIMHGHNIGYFRLTDSQYTAGILYSVASFSGILLTLIFLLEDLARPSSFEMMVVMEVLAPLCVALLSLGAYAVSRDEFERLLQYGGQLAVHPMKLSLEKAGWVAVDSKGVTWIPMFGEVKYEPLDPHMKNKLLEFCACCACYPYEEEEENTYVGPTTNGSPRRFT